VNSAPLGAQVRLDGELLDGRTPLLLRNVAAGEYRLEFEKDGHLSREVKFDLAPEEIKSLNVDLTEQGISSMFPEEDGIVVQGRAEDAGDRIIYLERGAYRVAREQGIVYLDPAFPQQRLIDALNISIPIMLTFASVLTINAVFSPPDSDWPVPPVVLAAHGVTLFMIGLDIGLNVYKRKQLGSFSYSTRSQELSRSRAQRYRDEAERLLEQGRLEEALAVYTHVVDTFPDSSFLPFCLYRIAGIHYLKGENEQAIAAYRRTAEDYPVPELYDECRKNLADILVAMGRFEEGLAQLDEMVFADPLFEKREIDVFRCDILANRAREDPSIAERSRDCYKALIELYPDLQDLETIGEKPEP
jgi:tetratricopeptide (TPR) repeat protein